MSARKYPTIDGETTEQRRARLHRDAARLYYHRVVKTLTGPARDAYLKRALEASNRYSTANKEKCRERTRRGYRTSKVHTETYGVTAAEYDSMVREQDGLCAICRSEPGRKALAIDHDHSLADKQESIRGLLCTRCNLMIGLSKDRVEVLKAAVEYLGG